MPRQDLSPQERASMMQGLSDAEALSEGLMDFDDFGGFHYLDDDDANDTYPPRHIPPVNPVKEKNARLLERLKRMTQEERDAMTQEERDQLVAEIF